ncbi:cleft lip and palate transmembrane protein 1-like protein [Diachasma alloeum]|uniref:cleft lip and palate transmembrane protein 1-like protein n=1 Tax=Diachasma alloeum TaxID=454923 RepID=UPI0007381067|nr:cleft lip and palate transmembrane protein 1-like protein [Diachasma alloeum]
MHRPSWTLIFSGVFLGYIAYAIYSISLLFVPPPCEAGKLCLKSYLNYKPKLQVHLFASPSAKPARHEVYRIHSELEFDYNVPKEMPISLQIPPKTRQNGTSFLHIIVLPKVTENKQQDYSFVNLQTDPYAVMTRIKLTQFAVPEAETFNLLGDKSTKSKGSSKNRAKPVSHLRSRVTFTMVTDAEELPAHKVPHELSQSLRITREGVFLPIINYDFLQTRHRDLVQIKPDDHIMNLTVSYAPTTMGMLRLLLQVKATMENMKSLGFSDRDVDEVKGIYADTNFYLLAGTIFIASMHLLFDFLAFKNDISFWKSRGSFEGLSVTTVIWRGFSQTIVFLYLLDEGSSLLVLIPSGIGTLIEIWKIKKVLRLQFTNSGGTIPKLTWKKDKKNENEENKTRQFDAESMRYLSYLLYPLVIGGAVYSLLYQPHKSWYSWTINSLVNGVYAFGFLFMLPQLFVNYKLKSVAHLPWRAFMYKAFNTFIDDVFAFIITMPTSHRVACFRDDIIFLIYLYQRWLYPVDKSRMDTTTIVEEPTMPSGRTKKSDKKKD